MEYQSYLLLGGRNEILNQSNNEAGVAAIRIMRRQTGDLANKNRPEGAVFFAASQSGA
jgi:hypothetical protein